MKYCNFLGNHSSRFVTAGYWVPFWFEEALQKLYAHEIWGRLVLKYTLQWDLRVIYQGSIYYIYKHAMIRYSNTSSMVKAIPG